MHALYAGPSGGGLSREHIELCAEGARHMPNLSGKWTEMLIYKLQSFIQTVLCAGLSFSFVNI